MRTAQTCIIVVVTLFLFWPPAMVSAQERYSSNQLVVQYEPQEAPLVLESEIARRKYESALNLIGGVKIFLSDMKVLVQGQQTPEEKLMRIQKMDNAIGVVRKTPLFPYDQNDANTIYLLTIDGSMTVPQAVDMYRQLHDIVFVEPNYLYGDVGI